jgi:Trk K+ transport system NAD-binding subunit
LSALLLIRKLNRTIRVVVRMFNQNLLSRLGAATTNVHALSTSGLVGPLLALIARTGEALGTFQMRDGTTQQIAEVEIAPGTPLPGQTVADFKDRYRTAVVAHYPAGMPERFASAVEPTALLQVGDRLVVCGTSEQLAPLLAHGPPDSLPDLLWAGTVRRLGRVIWRSLVMIDWPVKVCTSIFLSVILLSTLVFHFSVKTTHGGHHPIGDAFYHTISVMTTGADMRGEELGRGTWDNYFISGLRLVGMALTAAFTAIFTNYLVRANLGGALEVRRIPDSGHIVVCGLGNVGFRVVEELFKHGERVVAIERTRDNAFIATARRLGAAVIIGDATIPEALKQAHVAGARAVVAASNNDLVNVEIALLVRELNPAQRVVVRLTDTGLAETLRHAANVRLAVSIPELAAPAFVARLFGDRVRSIFLVRGRLMAVFDLQVRQEDRSLLETPFAKVAGTLRAILLSAVNADGKPKSVAFEKCPEVGDRLTLICPLHDLQALMHREGREAGA